MPTKLDKPLTREVPRDDLIMKFAPEGVYAREKGKRSWYGPISWTKVYYQCVQVQVNDNLAARAEKKRERKVLRSLI